MELYLNKFVKFDVDFKIDCIGKITKVGNLAKMYPLVIKKIDEFNDPVCYLRNLSDVKLISDEEAVFALLKV